MGKESVAETTNCRLCGSSQLELVMSLPATPLANDFRPLSDQNTPYTKFPLEVLRCNTCSHVQLKHVVDPRVLFSNYAYVSGTSKNFVKHFEDYADWLTTALGIEQGSKILEVGCNDATLLKFLSSLGMHCIGIDPAANVIENVQVPGIDLICNFFDSSSSLEIAERYGQLDLIVANNVFAHIWDLKNTISSASDLLRDGGYLVFEVSYLLDVVEKCLFDTIYHEHLDYHSLTALIPFLESLELTVIDAQRVDTHGGSIRVVAQRHNQDGRVNPRVYTLLEAERESGINTSETLHTFAAQVNKISLQTRSFIIGLKNQGARIAGFGAPAKMTTLTYTLGIAENILEYIVDDSPLKQHTFAPGGHIKVYPSTHLYESRPDYVLVLAWNFASSIVLNHPEFQSKFIIPIPKLQVV